jgi:hypothetical protein
MLWSDERIEMRVYEEEHSHPHPDEDSTVHASDVRQMMREVRDEYEAHLAQKISSHAAWMDTAVKQGIRQVGRIAVLLTVAEKVLHYFEGVPSDSRFSEEKQLIEELRLAIRTTKGEA